jgi:hypothetical protein
MFQSLKNISAARSEVKENKKPEDRTKVNPSDFAVKRLGLSVAPPMISKNPFFAHLSLLVLSFGIPRAFHWEIVSPQNEDAPADQKLGLPRNAGPYQKET